MQDIWWEGTNHAHYVLRSEFAYHAQCTEWTEYHRISGCLALLSCLYYICILLVLCIIALTPRFIDADILLHRFRFSCHLNTITNKLPSQFTSVSEPARCFIEGAYLCLPPCTQESQSTPLLAPKSHLRNFTFGGLFHLYGFEIYWSAISGTN